MFAITFTYINELYNANIVYIVFVLLLYLTVIPDHLGVWFWKWQFIDHNFQHFFFEYEWP